MKKSLLLINTVLLILGLGTSRAFANAPDAQLNELQFNLNGTTVDNLVDSNFTIDAQALGISFAAFNTTTGLGTLTLTYSPGVAGSSFFDVFLDEAVGTPFYNEYGTAVGTATAPATWEIGDSYASNIYNDASGISVDGLTDTNYLPVGASNLSTTCTTAGCNGDAAIAMGYSFSLSATDEEIITFTSSLTPPASGFYLSSECVCCHCCC
jgi:hypothetical protein